LLSTFNARSSDLCCSWGSDSADLAPGILQLSAAITLVTKLMGGSSLNKRKASSAVLA